MTELSRSCAYSADSLFQWDRRRPPQTAATSGRPHHEASHRHRGNLRRGGSDPLRLSVQSSHRLRRQRRHPTCHGAAGTRRPAHGGCDLAGDVGRTIGTFCMQHGPSAENAIDSVARCFGESVPVLMLPSAIRGGWRRYRPASTPPGDEAFSKSSEPIFLADEVSNVFRRAFAELKNRPSGPVMVGSLPTCGTRGVPEPLTYTPVLRTRYGDVPVTCRHGRSPARHPSGRSSMPSSTYTTRSPHRD